MGLEAFWEHENPPVICHGDTVECRLQRSDKKLTWPRLDLDGCAAPDVLLHLRHALAGRLVGVVRGAHRDLVLDAALALQVIPALPARRRKQRGGDLRV